MPTSEDAIRARHVDRAARARDDGGRARGESALEAKTRGGGIMLRMRSSVVGRIVMNKEGTARAKTQPADIALDAASGAREARRGEARRRDGTGRDGMGWDGMGWDGMTPFVYVFFVFFLMSFVRVLEGWID